MIITLSRIVCCIILLGSIAPVTRGNALPDSELLKLISEGKINDLESRIKTAGISVSSIAARAVVAADGMESVRLFESILSSAKANRIHKTLAASHLAGYYRLTSQAKKLSECIAILENNRDIVTGLTLRGNFPDHQEYVKQALTSGFMLQLGAFSKQDRANSFASSIHLESYKTYVVPLDRSGKKLFAVRLGYFDSRSDAEAAGKKHFGKLGKDFTIVSNIDE